MTTEFLKKTTQEAPKIEPEAPKSALVPPKSTLGLLKFDLGTRISFFFVSETLLGTEKGAQKGAEMEQKSFKNSMHVRYRFRKVIFELSGEK